MNIERGMEFGIAYALGGPHGVFSCRDKGWQLAACLGEAQQLGPIFFSLLLTLARSARKVAPPLAFVPKPPHSVAARQTIVTSAPKSARLHDPGRPVATHEGHAEQPHAFTMP